MQTTPQLHHVLVVLAYPLVLLLWLLLAAPKAHAPYTQQGWIGRYYLQLTADSAPRAGQRFALTITSPSQGASLSLSGATLLASSPTRGTVASSLPHVPLALRRESRGVYETSVRPLQVGLWSIILVVQGDRGTSQGIIPLRVEDPPPLPSWLVWRMELLTLAFLIYATWVHNRRDVLDEYVPAPESEMSRMELGI